ncbi:hypothetical protein NG799_03520 [Laspinema sp. D1]|uniref:Uncharacterized protein n=1 Tax=Laspinema palackyanum D2a TaxID=2953684 RepID=A0ABT2MKY1_9CYAN|nr:hypothetical protein [Laspinema sp. D2a]
MMPFFLESRSNSDEVRSLLVRQWMNPTNNLQVKLSQAISLLWKMAANGISNHLAQYL